MGDCFLCGKKVGALSSTFDFFTNFRQSLEGMTVYDTLCSHCSSNCGELSSQEKLSELKETEGYEKISKLKKTESQGNSNLWYLCPIFLGIMGGLLMFVALRNENEHMARKGLVLSLILSGIGFVLTVLVYLIMPELLM